MGKEIKIDFDKEDSSQTMMKQALNQAGNIMAQLGRKNDVAVKTRIALKNFTYTARVGEVELRVNGTDFSCDSIMDVFFKSLNKLRSKIKG